MVVVSMLSRAEFGSNDHRENAPHFILRFGLKTLLKGAKILILKTMRLLINI